MIMIIHSSNNCVSTEEFFEGGYECAGIWEEAVMDYLKDPIQAFVWETIKRWSPKKVFRQPGLERVSAEHKSVRQHALKAKSKWSVLTEQLASDRWGPRIRKSMRTRKYFYVFSCLPVA